LAEFSALFEQCQFIYETYIIEGAPHQINISWNVRGKVGERFFRIAPYLPKLRSRSFDESFSFPSLTSPATTTTQPQEEGSSSVVEHRRGSACWDPSLQGVGTDRTRTNTQKGFPREETLSQLRTILADAIKEIVTMMEDDSFQRYLNSSDFTELMTKTHISSLECLE